MAASKGSTIKVPSTKADGYKLAIAMLREMEDRSDECSMFQDGRGTQDNVALRYLDTLRSSGSRDVEVGFSEVLSDFISSNLDVDEGMVRPEVYEPKVVQLPIRRAQPSTVSEQ